MAHPSTYARSFRPLVITSDVCGHESEYLVSPKKDQVRRDADIARYAARVCQDCGDAANKAAWAAVQAEAAARGFTQNGDQWVHSCGYYHRTTDMMPPARCRNAACN